MKEGIYTYNILCMPLSAEWRNQNNIVPFLVLSYLFLSVSDYAYVDKSVFNSRYEDMIDIYMCGVWRIEYFVECYTINPSDEIRIYV